MRVNNGGDPGRDDYGLPPVDIEVPDDARELERDVQAYRRELRSLRRRLLARKLVGPLTRDGMVLPLLAGCLALTLLAATLLTVFTVGQGTIGGPLTRPGGARSAAPGPVAGSAGTGTTGSPAAREPATGRPGRPLPDAMVLVDGEPEHLVDLTGPYQFAVVLALIPPGCQCVRDLRQLARQVQGGAQIFLVGIRGADVSQLTSRIALARTHAVEDIGDLLPPLYRNSTTLTAVLVRKDDSVAGLVKDRHGFRITAQVRAMASAHAGQSPSPGTPATSPSARATAPSARAASPAAQATAPGARTTTAPATGATAAPAG
jgi:hypothetical protein